MNTMRDDGKKAFVVVNFTKGILKDVIDNVCVPYTWIILRRDNDKAVTAYPSGEHPSITKKRVKARENLDNNWMYHWTVIKYETDSYSDAEDWINKRNNKKQKTNMEDPALKKNPSIAEIKNPQLTKKRNKNRQEATIGENVTGQNTETQCTRKDHALINSDHLKTDQSALSKIWDKTKPPPVCQNSTNEKNVSNSNDGSTDAMGKGREGQAESIVDKSLTPLSQENRKMHLEEIETLKHPKEHYGKSQKPDLHSNTLSAPATVPKPLTTAKQICESNRHTRLPCPTVTSESMLNSQPREPGGEMCTKLTYHDQTPRQPAITSNILLTSHHKPNSINVNSQVYTSRNSLISTNRFSSLPPHSIHRQARFIQNHQQEIPRIQEMHDINFIDGNSSNQRIILRNNANRLQKVPKIPKLIDASRFHDVYNIGEKTCHQHVPDNAFAAQILSNLAHQSRCLTQRADEPKCILTEDNNLQHIPRDIVKVPTENYGSGQNYVFHDIMMNQLRATQNKQCSVNPSNRFFSQNLHQKRLSEDQSRKSTESYHTNHSSNISNITMNVFPYVQNSSNVPNQFNENSKLTEQIRFPRSYQEPQQHLGTPRRDSDIFIKAKSHNQKPRLQGVVKRTPPIRRRVEVQSTSYKPLQKKKFRGLPVYDSQLYQFPRGLEMAVDQSTDTNLHFKNNVAKSHVSERFPRVRDSECQTDKCQLEEPLSPHRDLVSEHQTATVHNKVPANEIDNNMLPSQMIRKQDCNAYRIPPKDDSSIKSTTEQPTASASTMDPKIIAEQEVLNIMATLYNKMGSEIIKVSKMSKKLQSNVLEMFATYQNLSKSINLFNASHGPQFRIPISGNVPSELPSEHVQVIPESYV